MAKAKWREEPGFGMLYHILNQYIYNSERIKCYVLLLILNENTFKLLRA